MEKDDETNIVSEKQNIDRRSLLLGTVGTAALVASNGLDTGVAVAQETSAKSNGKRPNVLVIWGDDVGWSNVSCYGDGIMGYRTPNIDRIANEGAMFTDHYAQPSCTAGRAAFITGQYPIRSGMTTVGQPGDTLGHQTESPSLGELFKNAGYRTGHFGKSHLGDRNEHLPTNHGFDEFFGNLYHLNVSEEEEQRDYQNFAKNWPEGKEDYERRFGARGVIHSLATEDVVAGEDPRFGPYLKQDIKDTGPLHRERMETFDEAEVVPRALEFMKNSKESDEPFFVWLNPSRMHIYVRLDDKWRYAAEDYTSEADLQGSGMLKHDHSIGAVLDFLDENGLADDTIVWYSTDNGPEHDSWPDGSTTPFRGQKMTTYEGGVRVPSILRWPGQVKPGTVLNGIQSHQDMFTSLAVAAGIDDPVGWVSDNKNGQIIDGVDNTKYWTGEEEKSARDHIFYYFQTQITAIRMGPWKWHFSTKENYYDNMVPRTYPVVFNIRMDPYESYDSKDSYGHLMQKVSWQSGPMKLLLNEHLQSLAKTPPIQKGKNLGVDADLVEKFLSQGHE